MEIFLILLTISLLKSKKLVIQMDQEISNKDKKINEALSK
jgi:hypothetical protein